MLFFSNANIADPAEYARRLDAARKLAEITGLELIEDKVSHGEWLEKVAKGFEDEPEGGARCRRCFEFSLRRAAMMGYPAFTTSLTISPHKNSKMVFEAGRAAEEACGSKFLEINFKKNNGFLESIRLAKEYGLYRQSFCGCEYSYAAMLARKASQDA